MKIVKKIVSRKNVILPALSRIFFLFYDYIHDQAERQHRVRPVVGIDRYVLDQGAASSHRVYRGLDAAEIPGFKVIGTDHRGRAASGGHDAFDDQGFASCIHKLENMRYFASLRDFTEIVLDFLGGDFRALQDLGREKLP